MNLERAEPILRLLDDSPFGRYRPSRFVWGTLGMILLATVVYVRAIVVNDLFWQDPSTLNGVTSLFSLTHFWVRAAGAYEPFSLSLLWLERRCFADAPMPYHIVGVAFHAANGMLLWLVLRRLNVRGAWLAAALFVVHPVQAQSVAWISQQPHLVCTLFYLIAVWAYLRWSRIRPPSIEGAATEPDDPPSQAIYVLAVASGTLAVLSDPVGISLPLVLMLLARWTRGALGAAEWRWLAPFFFSALIGATLNIILHHPSPQFLGVAPLLPLLQRVFFGGRAVAFYAFNLLRLYPAQLVHARWSSVGVWSAVPALLVVGFGLIAWTGRRRWGNGPAFSFLIFVALLLPGIVMVLTQSAPSIYVADHQQYLATAVPLAAIAAALMGVALRLSSSMTFRSARATVGIVAIVLLAAFAIIQSLTFRDARTAFKASLKHDPENASLRAQYALQLSADEPTGALKVLDDAGPSDATDLTLLDARARVLLALGRPDEAVSTYLLAQRLAPDHPDIRLGLAAAYDAAGAQAMAEGRHEDAFGDYRSALAGYELAREVNPSDEAIDDGIGKVMLHEGRFADGIDQFDAALRLNSAFVPARIHKAEALFKSAFAGAPEKLTAANLELREALRMDPSNVEALCAAADMQFQLRNFAAAEQDYRIAIHVDPDSAQVWTELGFAQSAQSRFQEAVHSFEKALALRSDAPDALRGKRLAKAQLASGNQKS